MPARSRLPLLILLLSAMAAPAWSGGRPPVDRSVGGGPTGRAPFRPRPELLSLLRPGAPLHVHETLGVPTFLWARPAAAPDALRERSSPEELRAAARSHLRRYAELYRLEDQDLAALEAAAVHDTGRGAVIVTLSPRVGGVEIFREEIKVAMARDLTLVALSGSTTGNAGLLRRAGGPRFDRSAAASVAAAVADAAGRPVAEEDLRPAGAMAGGYVRFTAEAGDSVAAATLAGPARAKRTLFRTPHRLEPAHYVEIDVAEAGTPDSEFLAYVISARDGEVLFRHSQTADAAYSYRVWADPVSLLPDDGPQGTAASPHPTGLPDGHQPAFVAPSLVTLESGPLSTGDPWLPPGATVTSGNNADAYADLVSPDGFSGGSDIRASVTSPGVFDRVYDTSQQPSSSSAQRMAAITQLFYDVNFLHDWFYDAGFDEAAGNAQVSNHGRGGLELDAMRAEAQDFSGRNNANMSTPSDGLRPRMQMYVFDGIGRRTLTVPSGPAAGLYPAGYALFGPTSFSVTGVLELVSDPSGSPTDGCELPFSPGVAGRIALIDRGTCTFALKVKNAQLSGAIGAIVANNVQGVLNMGGSDSTITIPSFFVSQDSGVALKAALGSGVTATLYREAVPDRDGTIDNQIVAHEWGHYISNRLIGNSTGLSNQQGRGMGEGWGDFHALIMTVRPEDAAVPSNPGYAGVYPVAGYVTAGGDDTGGYNDSHYFGIRRVPYSTDFSRNPLTFRHISNGEPLPAGAPILGDASGSNNAEVHNTGEIWATMLWECYAALLRDTARLTFDQARDRMRDYLVAGYKLTPSAPTFVEARDALLAAAFAGDPADHALFAEAFARRGLGLRAVAPDRSSTTNVGVVESFVAGGDLQFVGATLDDSVASCDQDGILDAGETGRLTITLRNTGSAALAATSAQVTAAGADLTLGNDGVVSFPPSSPYGTFSGSVEVTLAGADPFAIQHLDMVFDDPALAFAGPYSETFESRTHFDDLPGQSASDDVESAHPAFTPSGSAAAPQAAWVRHQAAAGQHWWLGPDPPFAADQWLVSPPLEVAPAGSFSFTFLHRHAFEASGSTFYDGGVIEISTNAGASWTDIGSSASPGYGGILASGGGNPLQGRPAYVSASPDYPAFHPVSVELGSAYQGQTVLVRFRIGTDVAVAAQGWEIDDLSFQNITNLPFPVLAPHAGNCVDSDLDGTPDLGDCAPLDAGTWAPPGEVLELALAGGDPTALGWQPPAAPGSAALLYDVLRAGSATGFGSAVCLESGGADLAAEDPAVPGGIAYYLVRSRNGCGSHLGADSAGSLRSGISCP
ncbi:MAG TPA: M36 family metallopeptidase [Candidatus Polarisedimenticolia bacterium]|nr:M36 family metallopeptidase [Candidatus Polarisedimenticolia bacterium]